MPHDSLELMKGTLEIMILRTLAGDPMHGYGIAQWIRARSGGALEIQDAALYQALRRLEQKGWVEAEWGTSENNRRARYYRLTDSGRQELQRETSILRRYVDAMFQVLAPSPTEA